MLKFEETLTGVFNWYHFSPKRRREMNNIAAVLEMDLAHIGDLKSVRWMASKSRAVVALLKDLPVVVMQMGTKRFVRVISKG